MYNQNKSDLEDSSLNQSFPPPPPHIIQSQKQLQHAELAITDHGSSDTDTESVLIVKRPILIRGGDSEFIKNFTTNEPNCNYYGANQSIEVCILYSI